MKPAPKLRPKFKLLEVGSIHSYFYWVSVHSILYFHRKNIDMSNKKRYKKRENFAKRRKA